MFGWTASVASEWGPPLRKAVIRAGLGSATLVGREGEGGEGGGGRMAVFSEVGRCAKL